MQKTTLVLGSVGAVLVLVACAAGQDEGAASAGAADTTNTPATTTTAGGRATTSGRTTTPRTSGTATPNTSDGGTATLSCYGGLGSCDPTNPAACGNGETCDIDGSSGQFQCFPPPNDAHLGDACDNGQGPFCSAGLACDQGTCKTYCCDDSLCAAGTTCQKTGEAGSIIIQVCK